MKIIHIADLHIGSKFNKINDEEKQKNLIAALNNSFKRVVSYAKLNGIRTIILSGDVFDKDLVSKKDKEYFYSIIRANSKINFYYIKGNHDINSCYCEKIKNLFSFESENKVTEYINGKDHILIAGYELNNQNNESLYSITPFSKENYNILILHGDISKSIGKDSINLNKLMDKNINYFALGHIHKRMNGNLSDNSIYQYPGCLMGRGFDEIGEKGFVVLDTTLNTQTFVPLDNYLFNRVEIDISSYSSIYDLLKYIENNIKMNSNLLLQIVFRGRLNFTMDLELMKENFAHKVFYLDLKNETKVVFNPNQPIDERSLKGLFLKLVSENSNLSEEEKELIIEYGLSKINKEEE